MAEAEYMVRASGYLQTLDDFNTIVLKSGADGVPVYLRDVARVQIDRKCAVASPNRMVKAKWLAAW